MLGVSIIPPYHTYILYEVYVAPGLMAMIQLFNGMQSSLSMVYDREMGNMRVLLVSPFPRWFLLSSQAARRHRWSRCCRSTPSWSSPGSGASSRRMVGYLTVLPALILSGLMLGALGMLLSSLDPAAREFRRRDELRDLSDVLRLLRALSAVAGAASRARCSTHLPAQSFHLCGRADPLRLYIEVNWLALAVVVGCPSSSSSALSLFFVPPSFGIPAAEGGRRRRGGLAPPQRAASD